MRKTILFLVIFLLTNQFIFSQNEKYQPRETIEYIKENYPDRSRDGGDTCSDPTVIPSLPYVDTGTTEGYNDDYDEICPYDAPGSPDVVYEYTPTSTETVTISLCHDATNYDTKLYVYEGTCTGSSVACNDDACSTAGFPSPYVSELQDVPLAGGITYYIIVDGYGGDFGDYGLSVESTIPPDHMAAQGPDHWITVGNYETRFTIGPTGDYPTLPAGFFGPGSDPFEGQICLEGNPFPSDLGDFDTIVQRTEDAEFFDPLPDNAIVPIEIVQLNLRSIAPIEVTYSGIPSFFDVFVELNVSFPLPEGSMDIGLLDPMGGTYNGEFPVIPRFIFNEVGGTGNFQTPDELIVFPFQNVSPPSLWNFPLVGEEFDPLGFLELVAPGGSRWLLEPVLRRQNGAYAHIAADNELIEGGGDGYESTWYFYSEEELGWWNIWFYDHPYDPLRSKRISAGIFLYPVVYEGYAEIIFNWSTPAWSDQGLPRPPLPEDFDGIPESAYIGRSDPIFEGVIPPEGIFVEIPCSTYFEIPAYNPEWISLDIRGSGFFLEEYSYINHVCYGREWGAYRDFGDAPEGEIAYPDLGVTGSFPTCSGGPAGFISHNNFGAWLGPSYDFELDGNAGNCPNFGPDSYDLDECAGDLDAGLITPIPGSLVDIPLRELSYGNCENPATPLGLTCETALWGPDIDLLVHNTMPNHEPYLDAYLNVLMDWNRDGSWANDPGTQCDQVMVPEHVLVDFVIPALYDGPVSDLFPTDFQIGPNSGYVWARFSITDAPVFDDWDGSGEFEDGETEDYLLFIDTDEEFDFGDAPDPTYPTLLANNGARHIIDPAIYLGASIDADLDGQPTPGANGDDNDGNDDEDGVGHGYVIPGHSCWFTFNASVTGYVNGWLDLNNDGDWNDAGEHIYNNRSLSPGSNYTTTTIPVTTVIDTLASRFRFTDYLVPTPSFEGLETNGEVEDYKIVILPLDYGDAPDPNYPTLLASNGARHIISDNLFLGSSVDYENDAHQSTDADGDDNDGNDDEDGLIIPVLQKGRTDSITVEISGGWSGHLYIWIDWNQDGSWIQFDELIHQSLLPAGTHQIPVRPPYNAVTGDTYLRCRLTIDSYCYPEGYKPTGEVEDYLITIEDDPDIKWSQPPVYNPEPDMHFWGWDEISIYGDSVIVADDWLCTNYNPVTEIHWWGSYLLWDSYPPEGPGSPTGFHLGIWTDVPFSEENPWSHPGELIWQYVTTRESLNEQVAGLDYHTDVGNEDTVFEYTLILPEENWFYQLPTVGIYWLSISAIYEDTPTYIWGWLSREPNWNDAAVKIFDPTLPGPGSVFVSGEPVTDSSQDPWDMSFVLLSDSPEVTTPVDITITVYQDSSLAKIEWSAVNGARFYIIFSSEDPEAEYPTGWTFQGVTPDLYWNDGPPLPSGKKKFYKVVAY
jgi:GEVED domain-containing protein